VQQNEDPNPKRRFNKLNKDIQLLIGQYRSSKWCEQCSDINKKQGKNYWDTIKKTVQIHKSSSIPTIVDNGTLYKTDEEKTHIFKKYFEEAFKEDQNADYDSRNFQSVNEWYNDFFTVNNIPNVGSTVIEEEYYANLNKGKNTSPGFDLISRSILRRLHEDVRKYILKMYNYCIENCYFPSEWKKDSIILITKPNLDHQKTASYRPIILQSVIGMNFEVILKNRKNAEIGHRIPRYQFGFKEDHSTIHPLITLTNNVQVCQQMGKKSAALFMDINKAFDTIWHKGLLYKMNMLNVPEYITHVIKNTLKRELWS
jgi:hypothetical protein